MFKKSRLEAVAPLAGLAPWVGGKRSLTSRALAPRIAATPHECYAEPFVGMGGVLMRKGMRAPAEVINDWNGEVVNLFRVVKHHTPAFLDELRFGLIARTELARLWKVDPSTLTDVQRAGRFFWIQRMNYGGLPRSKSFPSGRARGRGISAEAMRRYFQRAAERLSTVTIEHLDWPDFIAKFDAPGTLFYCDPPYYGVEHYYGPGLFARADFARLAATLRAIKGRFILSINDHPEIRRLFAWARIETASVTYRVRLVRDVQELIISDRRGRAGMVPAKGR